MHPLGAHHKFFINKKFIGCSKKGNQINNTILNWTYYNKIKKEHYENYFIYAYNKKSYKDKKESKKSSKYRKPKIYKTGT